MQHALVSKIHYSYHRVKLGFVCLPGNLTSHDIYELCQHRTQLSKIKTIVYGNQNFANILHLTYPIYFYGSGYFPEIVLSLFARNRTDYEKC